METTKIVIQFLHDVAPPYQDDVASGFLPSQSNQWESIVANFPGISIAPRFSGIDLDQVKMAESTSISDASKPESSLLDFFIVEVPENEQSDAVLESILALPGVVTAFIEPTAVDPVVNPSDDPLFPFQGYLYAAPTGIDAVFSWSMPGGDGSGQHVVDIEQGWTLDHEDLAAKNAVRIHGLNSDASRSHGTAVLGEICAVDNSLGAIGIVPNLQSVLVSSTTGSSVAQAIVSSANYLSNAVKDVGVILIEQQWVTFNGVDLMIVEAASDVYQAIRYATQLGHLVVEAAGNGSVDLDSYQDRGKFIFRRNDPNYRDSGALVVGAGSSSVPHYRLNFSNFGSRIDCYGWGQNVYTTSSDPSGSKNRYTAGFNGTSSASPIVTGAALALQGMKRAGPDKTPLNPTLMRAVLSDPALGTLSRNPGSDRIGVMPNLRRISQSFLQLSPQLYIRDFVSDNGSPHAAVSSTSPDIIIRRTIVGDPQTQFGEGSGTENDPFLSEAISQGVDHFGYVRVRNKSGIAPGPGAVVSLYWAAPATLVRPSQWRLIGSLQANIPTGDYLTVIGPINWPMASVPPPGHYCFVATVSHPFDLVPDLAVMEPINNFAGFIQSNNNIAWRNFNVVDIRPVGPTESTLMPFFVPNPEPGAFVDMRVEVVSSLPKGSELYIDMPKTIVPNPALKSSIYGSIVRVTLNPDGNSEPFKSQNLPQQSYLSLHARVPSEYWNEGSYEIYARQFYREVEVGRITWVLKLPPG